MIYFSFFILFIILAVIAHTVYQNNIEKKEALAFLKKEFPKEWKSLLNHHVHFYRELNTIDKHLFEKQVQRFIATKKIRGANTDIDDTIKLMVASSATIPSFAFPDFNYPNVNEVIIYPNTFDNQFGTNLSEGDKSIEGMVGSGIMSGKMILSKPDLLKAYDGQPHTFNVGIHEFVHLLDATDGAIDGVPENLLDKPYIGPWIREIREEMRQIAEGDSDINPYGLTNNAEFLAVVSEYFLSNPEKFKKRHFELYQFLVKIFHREPL